MKFSFLLDQMNTYGVNFLTVVSVLGREYKLLSQNLQMMVIEIVKTLPVFEPVY